MKLLVMRHAEAESGMQMDPTRHLTDTGKRQAKMMGKWLARQDEKPKLLLESNFHRARSTAKRVGKQLDLEPQTCWFLDPENEPEVAWKAIKDKAKDAGVDCVLAVTHGPLVEKMLAYLTGSQYPRQFHFAHAAIAMFETTTGARGILHWLVTPNTVARDEGKDDNVIDDVTRAVEAAVQVVALSLEAFQESEHCAEPALAG